MEYIDFSAGQHGHHDGMEDLGAAATALPVQHYALPASYTGATDPSKQQQPGYMNPSFTGPISCDIKPRLTKEQHDILEAHFQRQNKPNTNTKKNFAETLNVSLDKVNVRSLSFPLRNAQLRLANVWRIRTGSRTVVRS